MSHLHLLLCFLLLGHLSVGLSVSVDLSRLCTRHLFLQHLCLFIGPLLHKTPCTTKPPPLFCLSGLFCPPSLLYQLDYAISLTLCQSSQVIAFVFTLSHPKSYIFVSSIPLSVSAHHYSRIDRLQLA